MQADTLAGDTTLGDITLGGTTRVRVLGSMAATGLGREFSLGQGLVAGLGDGVFGARGFLAISFAPYGK